MPRTKQASTGVTMAKLAKELGMTQAAVSYALNKKSGVSNSTRERVLKLAEVLGYRRNRLAVGLRTSVSKSVGVLMPCFGGGEDDLLAGIGKALGDDYSVWFSSYRYSEEQELKLLNSFEEHMVDGIFITPSNNPATRERLQKIIASSSTRVIQLDHYLPGLKASRVTEDNEHLTRLCTEHMISLGHKNIAYLGKMRTHTGTSDRENGYKSTMRAAGLKPYIPKSSYQENRKNSREFFRMQTETALSHSPRPTAIVADEFQCAYETLERMGLRCPADISLAGIDLDFSEDIIFSYRASWKVSPTMAVWSIEKIGYEAGKLFLKERENPDLPPQHISVPGRLIVGNSTAPLRK